MSRKMLQGLSYDEADITGPFSDRECLGSC